MTPADHRTGSTLLVGREREQAVLRDHLTAALVGHGGLVLIGGEAGIGKTSLAENLCHAAAEQCALVLVGRCYDRTETPPYGPWVELFARYRAMNDTPPLPTAFAQRGTVGEVASQTALFQQVQDFFTTVSARKPTLLLLDDLHWADPASLDLLRHLARTVADLPLLILTTYRTDELTRHHPLYQLLPALVRESSAVRLDLRPFTADDLRALVAGRYMLPEADTASLVAYLHARSEGNPFFAGELLRALEEARALTHGDDGWGGGAVTEVRLPPLLRQVIDGRLARLGEDAEAPLEVAAVIGQEVPLTLWVAVGERDEETLLRLLERAGTARVLEETPDGAGIRFTHALIREALYERIPAIRRRRMHRTVAEALTSTREPDPDAVAYHFQQAGDARAAEWLMRAGERAQRSYAWTTAAERYEAALALLEGQPTETDQRGWLLYRLAWLCRYSDPRQSSSYMQEAIRAAERSGDRVLAALGHFFHGMDRCYAGEVAEGMAEMAAAVAVSETLSPEEFDRYNLGNMAATGLRGSGVGTYMLVLGGLGRYAETLAMEERFLARTPVPAPGSERGGSGYGDGYLALGRAHAVMGEVAAAREAFARARSAYRAAEHHVLVAVVADHELRMVTLRYQTEQHAEHERIAMDGEQAWREGRGTVADLPPRIAWLPLLIHRGEWAEARALAEEARIAIFQGLWRHRFTSLLGPLAHCQGGVGVAWECVREVLAKGPATDPGTTNFSYGTLMQMLAAYLSLDTGDLTAAHAWIEAHDRWLAWNGAVLGRADGALLWARYHQVAGEMEQAREHAERALTLASEPRQPLALLAAHRLLGELDTDARRDGDAVTHLNTSLILADACAAPYERALTLLARAELHCATGDAPAAQSALDAARTICTRLGAAPALARTEQIAAMLMTTTPAKPSYPGGLSAREVEVLRLVTEGLTNAQVAERLFVSPHTINSHLTAIYNKLGVPSRSAAIRFALDHGLR